MNYCNSIITICDITGGGVDYYSGLHNFTFSAGQIDVSFDIFITDDNILERNEIFNLTIANSLPPNRVIAASPHKAVTVIIVDNDGN